MGITEFTKSKLKKTYAYVLSETYIGINERRYSGMGMNSGIKG